MFDIGFSELVLVFVIGLIVLGPQRLPVAVKTVVGWIRAIRSLAANVQHELAQELKLQELQESLKKVEEAGRGTLSPELKESMEELRKTADSMKRSVSQSIDIEKEEDEANTIHSAQHRYAPEPAATETAATPASAEHQASAPAQAPSAVAGADAAVQPAPAAAAQRPSAAPSAPAVPSSAAPAAVVSAPAQAPAGDAARSSESARPSATSSSAGDER